jgi:hypothetical protein
MSSFASGKFALRATGQSLAREFGPKGVHIAHAIIDGVIDIPRTKEWPVNGGVDDGKISSDAVSLPPNHMPVQDEEYKTIGRSTYRAWADFLFYRLPILTGICTLNQGPTSLKSLMFVLMWRSSR